MSNSQYQWLLSIPGLGLVAVVAVAVLGVQPPGVKKADASSATAVSSSVTDAAAAAKQAPAANPGDYLTRRGVLSEPQFWFGRQPAKGQKIEYLVVTLPDPVGSHLGYVFDQGADAVLRGVSAAGYVFEGHWFPWEVVGESKEKQPIRSGNSETDPGVLLFRKAHDVNHRLVVLVPGEDPVTGIRVGALKAALDLAATANYTCPLHPIRVVSPIFSGSQASLARVLVGFHGRGVTFAISSGSGTGLQPWDKLDETSEENHKKLSDLCRGSGGKILLTSIPVSVQRKAALHYFASPAVFDPGQDLANGPSNPVLYAALTEANTGYGAALSEQRTDSPAVELRFPMHLSRMAGVLAKDQRAREERLGLAAGGRISLLAQDAGRAGGDLLPSGDESRTAALNLERLNHFWGVIRRERIRYVEIGATDGRDRLFLIQLLRQNCPASVPFVYNADELLGHPDYLPYTRGTVVASTYPLRPEHQGWTGAAGRREAFAMSGMQGTFNAVLAQLGMSGGMIDYAPPAAAEADRPAARSRPPVWITTVGENGDPVPLAYYRNLPVDIRAGMIDHMTADRVSVHQQYQPHRPGLRYLALAITLAGAWVALRVRQAPDPSGSVTPHAAELRTIFAALAAAGVSLAAVPVLIYFSTFFRVAFGPPSWGWVGYWRDVLVVAPVLGVTCAVWVVFVRTLPTGWARRLVRRPAAGDPTVWPRRVTGLLLLTTVAGLGYLGVEHALMGEDRRWLFVERAADTDAGASPLIPAAAFAVGFVVCGVLGLHVFHDLTRRRTPCPFPPAGEQSVGDDPAEDRYRRAASEVVDRTARLNWTLESPGRAFVGPLLPGQKRWDVRRLHVGGVVLLLFAAGLGLVVVIRAHPTWETWSWNVLFLAGFAGLGVLTVLAGYQMYHAWKGVERLTAAILGVPMAGAFDRFPDKISRLFGQYLLASRSKLRDRDVLLYLRDSAARACDPSPATSGGVYEATSLDANQAATNAHGVYARWKNHRAGRAAPDEEPGHGPAPPPGLVGDPALEVADLCRLSAELVGCLIPVWAREDRPIGAAFGLAPTTTDRPEAKGWVERTEQFVAVMAVVFLSQYLVRMRRLAVMAAVASGALLTAATTYQFQPEGLFMTGGLILAVAVGSLILWVLFEINRNELVSRVCHSTPNRFSLDAAFLTNVGTFVLPLAVVVATQFAGRTRAVVEPVLGWFR